MYVSVSFQIIRARGSVRVRVRIRTPCRGLVRVKILSRVQARLISGGIFGKGVVSGVGCLQGGYLVESHVGLLCTKQDDNP